MSVFRVEKVENVTKTFRIDKNIVDKLELICDKKNISLNKLVVQCIEFALDNMEDDED